MLYELHNQGTDKFVYTQGARRDPLCDDFDLCVSCHEKERHPHTMERFGLDIDVGGDLKQANPQEARKLSIQRCIQLLVHSSQCRDANCRQPPCKKMKRVVAHTKACKRKMNGDCPICKNLLALCCYHAKHCQETKCSVPFCSTIKQKLKQQQQQRAPALLQQQIEPQVQQKALQQLMALLRFSTSHNQQQEILQILQSNPLTGATTRQNAQNQQAAGDGEGGEGPVGDGGVSPQPQL